MFKLWSETKPDILSTLKLDLEMRAWSDLGPDEKETMWKHIQVTHFFNCTRLAVCHEYDFFSEDLTENSRRKEVITLSIAALNDSYKYSAFAKNYLQDPSIYSACTDFYAIFKDGNQDICLELLSLYAKICIYHGKKAMRVWQNSDETEDQFNKRQTDTKYYYFDKFAESINDLFDQFFVNLILTRQGFMSRQPQEIIEKIYQPTLSFLSSGEFETVNRDLSDAFEDYRKRDYSGCVTKSITALQAFLQVSVNGVVGKGDISRLIVESKTKKLIPDDIFTETIFKNIESILSRERQETGDAHPKKEYANEKNARLVMNLIIVFIQHYISLQK